VPIILLLRTATTLVSLALLATGGHLLWSWYDGELVRDAFGALVRTREDWRLWAGAALLAWSVLGRAVLTPLLARSDDRPSRRVRENGRRQAGASGSDLYVEMHGPEGAPVILFTHGWGLDSTVWSYAKADLADRFRLVVWDLPGLGQSKAAPGAGVSLEAFAADLAGLVRAIERPVVLVGHSIGGMTIQTLFRDHPEISSRVAGVVLLNTTYTDPLKTMVLSSVLEPLRRPVLEPLMRAAAWLQPLVWLSQWQSYLSGSAHMAHRFGFGKYVTRSQLDHSALLATRNPPAIQARGNLAMFRWDATGAMPRGGPPLLVIGGERDIITKPSASQAIAASGGGRLEIIEGVNHIGFLERSDLYDQLIGDFAGDAHRAASRAA
jgi:pimeloyl-ACP methyl ester carboxylesterase